MYKIKCKNCGQTSHRLKTRVKEHAKAIAMLHENSLLAKHHMRHSHQAHFTSVEIVHRSLAWRDTNAINEHIALPNVYNNKEFVEVIKNALETFNF